MELSPRKLKVLAAIVNIYVATGEPVGSKLLAEEAGVSSATIRSEMASLVELGLLEQPHTSAGRIPSQKGYRVYINQLMEMPRINLEEEKFFDGLLKQSAYEPEKLLGVVSQILARTTKLAVISTMPSSSHAMIKGVQFVQTSRRTAMVILMTSTGVMKNQIFRCDFDITTEMLRVFFRIFNETLAGLPVGAVTPMLLESMGVSFGEMLTLTRPALRAVLEVARDCMNAEVNLNGQTNLLFYPEFAQGDVRLIMDFLESKQALTKFLSRDFQDSKPISGKEKAEVLIGDEANQPELAHSSMIIAHYNIHGQTAGVIGIIGPTRMDYGKLIGYLEYLSGTVGTMLTQLMEEQ